jgi:hypothetical protein
MANQPSFAVRGAEIHSRHMWNWEHTRRMLDFCSENNLNALVFHQNDLLDQVANPEAFLPREMMKRAFPAYLHNIENAREYLRKVAACARERGIDFYFEIKEIMYPIYFLSAYPQLIKDGILCPNDPFWFDYLEAKLDAAYETIPELAGIIVSTATKESQLSMVNSKCRCSVCRQTPDSVWYQKVADRLYQSCQKAGRKLIIRDFVRSPKDHEEMISASAGAPPEVIISLKNTPHDFYPTFPHNPRIGAVGGHQQWIEYDVWGQFFGMGVFPCILLEDMKRRMQYALDHGATGFIARTDWECMTEGSAMNSLNKLNLYGAALLSYDLDTNFDVIYREWLRHSVSTAFSVSDIPSAPGVSGELSQANLAKLRSIFDKTWTVFAEGIYVGDCVFHEDGMIPITLDDAWWIMTENHSLADWDPSKKSALDMTPANVKRLLGQKETALALIRKLRDEVVDDPDGLGLEPWFHEDLTVTFQMFVLYIEGFYYAARACILTKYYLETKKAPDHSAAVAAVRELSDYRERLKPHVSRTGMHHYVYMMLDDFRLENLIADLNRKLK